MGFDLHHLGRAAEAEAAYRRAIDLDPGKSAPYGNLARILKAQGRYFESLEMFECLVKLNFNQAQLFSQSEA